MTNFLSLKKVSFSYITDLDSKKKIIDNLSLEISQGEIVSLVGFSGCGKTTLVKLILGILSPDTGSISLQGESILESREKGLINYVPQQNTLLPHLTVKENILLPLKINNKKINKKELKELLSAMLLDKIQNLYPKQLSGGFSQRVATARALITNPTVLLMDEPFASLDEFSREKINEDLLKWQKKCNMTIIFVTHNIQEAVFLSKTVLVLSGKFSKIVAKLKIRKHRKIKKFRETNGFYDYVNRIRKSMSL
jgi:NitT/TauT family transport system ATP-binding protein